MSYSREINIVKEEVLKLVYEWLTDQVVAMREELGLEQEQLEQEGLEHEGLEQPD